MIAAAVTIVMAMAVAVAVTMAFLIVMKLIVAVAASLIPAVATVRTSMGFVCSHGWHLFSLVTP